MALNTFAADAPDRPLHVLYLGPVSMGGGARGGGFGGGAHELRLSARPDAGARGDLL